MPLRFLRLTVVEISVVFVTLALIVVSAIMYIAARPKLDLILVAAPLTCSIAILTAEYLSGKLRVDLTPLGFAPSAYTLYYVVTEYLREVGGPLTLSYSILLGSTIAIAALTIILLSLR